MLGKNEFHDTRHIPRDIPFQDIVAYSDVSRSKSDLGPRVGGGVVIYQAGRITTRKSILLSPALSTFDAEVAMAATAMTEVLEISTARFSNDLWLLLDNKELARKPLQILSCSSQSIFSKVSSLAFTTLPPTYVT